MDFFRKMQIFLLLNKQQQPEKSKHFSSALAISMDFRKRIFFFNIFFSFEKLSLLVCIFPGPFLLPEHELVEMAFFVLFSSGFSIQEFFLYRNQKKGTQHVKLWFSGTKISFTKRASYSDFFGLIRFTYKNSYYVFQETTHKRILKEKLMKNSVKVKFSLLFFFSYRKSK